MTAAALIGTKGKEKSQILASARCTYDEASRLKAVGDDQCEVEYSHLENSPLVEHIEYRNNENVLMTGRKQYEHLNRLALIESQPSNDSPIRFVCEYNLENQRTKAVREDKSEWQYGYDELGQVISGHKIDSDNKPVRQFDYSYDSIGNRKKAIIDGEEAAYESDNLNRLTSRKAAVQKASDENTAAGVSIAAEASDSPSLASANKDVSFLYDPDGNLLNDGQWQYTWDAENRLIAMKSLLTAVSANQKRLEFIYDAQSRRIGKQVCNWDSDHWALVANLHFVYDGWNMIAEYEQKSEYICSIGGLKYYLWGVDLSGSTHGVGGIGGLLCVADYSTTPSSYFVSYDGNGNVSAFIGAANGMINSMMEYNPSGQPIKAVGSLSFSFRFSTKYMDIETGLLYYGYRYYQPRHVKWLSRDRIGEYGGVNIYCIMHNDAINSIDLLGMFTPPNPSGDAFHAISVSGGDADAGLYMNNTTQTKYVNGPTGHGQSCCRDKKIGTLSLDYIFADASYNYNVLTESGVPSWIQSNKWTGMPVIGINYVGAGMAMSFSPNVRGKLCCPNLQWKQYKSVPLSGVWTDDTSNNYGTAYFDFPGTGAISVSPIIMLYWRGLYCSDLLVYSMYFDVKTSETSNIGNVIFNYQW